MGGVGSTRWGLHARKTQVEECIKLCLRNLKGYLKPGIAGRIQWNKNEMGFLVIGHDQPRGIRFFYTVKPTGKDKVDANYYVRLTSTEMPNGGLRYWFECPNVGCKNRARCLYFPPYGSYFACRACYDLTYRSSQEQYSDRKLYGFIAGIMQDKHPGSSWKDWKQVFEKDYFSTRVS